MSPADARTLAIVAIIALAPVALILVAAIMRGYTISLHMKRPRRGRRDE